MRKTLCYTVALSALSLLPVLPLLLTACGSDESTGTVQEVAVAPMTELTAVMPIGTSDGYAGEYGDGYDDDETTRASAANTWAGTEKVAVAMKTPNGTTFTLKQHSVGAGGKLTPTDASSPFYWVSSKGAHSLKAWYYGDGTYRNSSGADWTVPAVQTSAVLQDRDFLYASGNLTYNDGAATALKFYHQMSKVTVTVQYLNTGLTTVSGVKLGNNNICLTGNFVEPAIGTVQGTWTTKADTKSTITMYGTAASATTTYTALVVPQSLSNDTLLTVQTNDGTVYYTGAMTFNAGKTHAFTITVNNNVVTVTKAGTAITAWQPQPGGGTGNIADEATQKSAEVGDLLHSDGTLSKTPISGKTPIAIVAYVGNDIFTESGTGSGYGGHGLAICLKEVGKFQWKNANTSAGLTYITTDALALTKDKEHVSGWYNTTKLVGTAGTSNTTVYPAFYRARIYNGLAAEPKAKTTGWFLASAGQWSKIIEGLSGYTPTFRSTVGSSLTTAVKKMNDKMAVAGSGNYTPFTTTSNDHYWSSSEYSSSKAVRQCFHSNGFHFYDESKTTSYRVRPVIAF